MCGIAGLIRPSAEDAGHTAAVLEQLAHRGPDDWGVLTYERATGMHAGRFHSDHGPAEVVLMHRRLAIIDLTQTGWQPMSTRDGRFSIVFNGEIYNHVELRAELQSLGHEFRSRSDTEVLLACYAQWGQAALRRLIGMFAFAILDTKRRVVFLARDFFGIKPLYYRLAGKSLFFASEPKPLLAFGANGRRANARTLLLYLRHGVTDHDSETLFEDVYQLPAAHCAEVGLDAPTNFEPVQYWQPGTQPKERVSFQVAAERVRELFLENVRLHLRSDVPLGAALSGGIDSSSIVHAMRHVDPKLEIHTFSYIADGPLSEERWVDEINQSADCCVHKIQSHSEDLLREFPRLMDAQQEPFISTSPYAQFRVFAAARRAGIKVMLDGQGADEILGGYTYLRAARLASLVQNGHWAEAIRFCHQSAQAGAGRGWLLLRSADYLMPRSVQQVFRNLVRKSLTPPWINKTWFTEREATVPLLRGNCEGDVLRCELIRLLTRTSLPHLLRYEDRNSMAFSIESRVPFLTPMLVNLLLSLPEHYIIAPDGTTKSVFRRAMRGIVPNAILDRRDKVGFATPEKKWLQQVNGWVQQLLDSRAGHSAPFLDRDNAQHEWQAILRGRASFGSHVWRWLNAIQWAEQFQVQFD